MPLDTRYISSQGEAEGYLPTSLMELFQYAQSKSKSSKERSYEKGFLSCQSGMMLEHSEITIQNVKQHSVNSEEYQTILSYAEVSRVKTFRVLEKAKEYAEKEAVCGRNMLVSFARFDHDTCSWRIPHSLFQGDLATYSQTWPRWGMMVHGECYRLPPWVTDTSVNAFGDCLCEDKTKMLFTTPNTSGLDRGSNSRRAQKRRGMYIYETSKLYPTPCSTDYKSTGINSKPRDRLDYAIEIGITKSKDFRKSPTPRSNGMCGGTGAFKLISENELLTQEEKKSMQSGNGGKLNPDWVEWLMGWPIGWTDIANNNPICIIPPDSDPAELPKSDPHNIERLTNNRKNRGSRLRTIGNGQVPDVAFASKCFLIRILDAIDMRKPICYHNESKPTEGNNHGRTNLDDDMRSDPR